HATSRDWTAPRPPRASEIPTALVSWRGRDRAPGGPAMKIVERKVSAGDGPLFDLHEFLSRPLFAHLAHASEHGPRDSPVWFHWDGSAVWIIGGDTFPANLRRDPRCAVGVVDFDPATGRCQHVGIRGTAEVLPFDTATARTIFRRYFGPDEADWDPRFAD